MIGLVIVSHSAKIAEGVRELTQQIAQDRLSMALAAGIGDHDKGIGTDPIRIMDAIKSVYSVDGVIVFMDLGSAVLSTETAIDLLDPTWREHIHLCYGPLIEGVVVAAVQALIGQPVQTVLAEANAALGAKHAHLTEALPESVLSPLALNSLSTVHAHELVLRVPNKLGLHARPAAQLVKIASQYKSRLLIRNKTRLANAHSINQIAVLGARQGDELRFLADGEDAEPLLKEIQAFANNNFGELLHSSSPNNLPYQAKTNYPAHVLTGIPASKGIAIAEAYSIITTMPDVAPRKILDAVAETLRLQSAIHSVVEELKHLAETSLQRLGQHEASIFEAQVLILQDSELQDSACKQIMETQVNAESVWWQVIEQLVQRYRELEDALLDERANDIHELGKHVLQRLAPVPAKLSQPTKPFILLVSEPSSADFAQLDEQLVMGIIAEKGGLSSHSTIIARALGVPTIIGFKDISKIQAGHLIAMDGEKGWVWTALSSSEQAELEEATRHWLRARAQMRLHSQSIALTLDGKQIDILANIGKVEDVPHALEIGAEGVGLLRTEYLFMNRDNLPSEDEQYDLYSQAAQALHGYPLIIRTLDLGGDKPLKSIPLEFEANPLLGYRGLRYWLASPAIHISQLRAIYRASALCNNIKLMLPMLSTLNELEQAKQIIQQVQAKLAVDGILYNPATELGIMIEVPSTVFIAEQLAKQVDFFSIGTNDLTQYMMATDRNHPHLHQLADYFQPAVLQAIKHVVATAQRAKIDLSVCGEMAGDPLAIPLLVAMGISKLSMNTPAIAEAKATIRSLKTELLQDLLADILDLPSAEAIKARLQAVKHDLSS